MKNYYNILGVDDKANPEDIKAAYRSLAKQNHPDANQSGGNQSDDAMKEINEAYECLKDPIKREEYDKRFVYYKRSQERNRMKVDWVSVAKGVSIILAVAFGAILLVSATRSNRKR